jgi:hypothetical protein
MARKIKYRGRFEILSRNEDAFLRGYKKGNLLGKHSNVSKVKADLKEKAEQLDEKSVKMMLSQLFLLANESPKHEEIVGSIAEFLAYSTSDCPLFEEAYDRHREERDTKIREIISSRTVLPVPEAGKVDKKKIDEDLAFLNSRVSYGKQLLSLVAGISRFRGTTGHIAFSKSESAFNRKLVSRGILEQKGRSYRLTRHGLTFVGVYLSKNPKKLQRLREL